MHQPTWENARRMRVGAVSYLNTKPLVYRLTELAPEIELVFDVPSRLADALADGQLDVGLIPSIEYLRVPAYTLVSDACIACRGPVLSVKLLSRTPISQIRTLALDEGSRTSSVLVQILLRELHGLQPALLPLPIGEDPAHARADAILLIGDRAIQAGPDTGFVEQWDLGEQWFRWSKLPFVFALWVGREGLDLSGVATVLKQARDAGVAHVEEIARAEAAGVGLSPQRTLEYLRDNLYFHFGPRERQGLELYYYRASRLGLVTRP
jgi:chorismate dehydratase